MFNIQWSMNTAMAHSSNQSTLTFTECHYQTFLLYTMGKNSPILLKRSTYNAFTMQSPMTSIYSEIFRCTPSMKTPPIPLWRFGWVVTQSIWCAKIWCWGNFSKLLFHQNILSFFSQQMQKRNIDEVMTFYWRSSKIEGVINF